MQSRKLGLAVAALAVAAAIVLFVVLRDDASDSGASKATTPTAQTPGENGAAPGRDGVRGRPKEPKVATIVVRGGQPAGGVQELTFEKGERIRFIVESDVADEVHLHGYDIAKPVDAGGVVKFDLPASLEGVFEVELEDRVVPLAEVTVNP